ncbi:hypothetical protein ACIBL6_16110 [Streptomyces sp. NPDC050400]
MARTGASTGPEHAEDDDVEAVEFVNDLDTVVGGEVMRGCGNDDPY